MSRTEGARPEGARPEGARPEGARPEGARPEGARPVVAVGVAAGWLVATLLLAWLTIYPMIFVVLGSRHLLATIGGIGHSPLDSDETTVWIYPAGCGAAILIPLFVALNHVVARRWRLAGSRKALLWLGTGALVAAFNLWFWLGTDTSARALLPEGIFW